MVDTGLPPPHSEIAERGVVGAALLDQRTIDYVAHVLDPLDFYVENLRTIWQAVLGIHLDGADVDASTVATELHRVGRLEAVGGLAYLADLIDAVPAAIHPETLARTVADMARFRALGLRLSLATAAALTCDERGVVEALDAVRAVQDGASDALPTETAAELDRVVFPSSSRWLVDGWWQAEGVGWLAGWEKSSKSLFALSLALAVATGRPWFRREVTRGPVLAIFEEDHRRDVQRRLRRVGHAIGIDWRTGDLHLRCQGGLDLTDRRSRGRLVAAVRKLRPVLLIIDPWRAVTPSVDENSSTEVAKPLFFLRRLQAEHGCAVMVLHHMRKAASTGQDAARVAHRIRGSGAMGAWYDSIVAVNRASEEDHELVAVHRAGPAAGPIRIRIAWDDVIGGLTMIEDRFAVASTGLSIHGAQQKAAPEQQDAFGPEGRSDR